MSMIKALVISSILLNVGMLLGRFSGFVREAALAGSFGVSAEADVAVLMLSVPDLLVNILVGGGLAAALIPEFTQDAIRSRLVWFQSLLVFTLLFIFIAVLLILGVEALLQLLAPGFSDYQVSISRDVFALVLWLIPMTVATGIMTAYLQAYNRFAMASLGTLIINVVIIVGLLCIMYLEGSLLMLGAFVLVGGGVRLAMQFFSAVRLAGAPICKLTPWEIDRALFIRYLQVAGSGSLLLCFPVIVRAFVSNLGEGSVAQISYAIKLVELPLALTVTFLSVVFFPRLASAYGKENKQFSELVVWGMRLTLFLALVATVSINSIAPALVQLVYGYGSMTKEAISTVTHLFELGLISLSCMGVANFITAVFNAQKDTRTPLIINSVALGVLLLLLIFGGAESMEGVMVSLVVAYAVSAILFVLMLFIRFQGIRLQLLSPASCLVIILIPLGLYYLIPVVLSGVTGAITELLAAFCVAAMCCVFAIFLVPTVRQRLLRKWKS